MANEWVSPTGYVDSVGSWSNEQCAYDNDLTTRCFTICHSYFWSSFLELTINAIYCSKVKFYASYDGTTGINKIDLDVYYDGAWHDVFEGSYLHYVWTEKSLGEGTYYVTKMRMRFYNNSSNFHAVNLMEAMFYQAVGIPKVTTNAATSVGSGKATLNGNITDTGGEACTVRGFKYKEGTDGEELDTSDVGSFQKGAFSKSLTGLDPNKKYYFKAYATNTSGTGYGSWLSFGENIVVPTVTTSAATGIDYEKATLNGNITATGGQDPTERGFEWKIGVGGTISKLPQTGTFGIGAYSILLSNLDANITYYFRAYAKNGAGTAYGDWLNFTTDYTSPTVKTHNATNELTTQVTGNGQIIKTGGADCDEIGFEYGLSKVPTWLKNEVAGGYGVGFFDLTIDGLTANTEYWYRAYAKRYE